MNACGRWCNTDSMPLLGRGLPAINPHDPNRGGNLPISHLTADAYALSEIGIILLIVKPGCASDLYAVDGFSIAKSFDRCLPGREPVSNGENHDIGVVRPKRYPPKNAHFAVDSSCRRTRPYPFPGESLNDPW